MTGSEFNVDTFDEAVKDLIKDITIKFINKPDLEPLESWKSFNGDDIRLLLAKTDYIW